MDIKRLFTLALFGIFLLTLFTQSVNAFEFDNVKYYHEETKTVEVRNTVLGIPFFKLDKVAEIQLLSDQNVYVIAGEDRKVAEFEIRNFESNYKNAFKDFEFYNIKRGMKAMDRDFTLKYALPITEEFDVFEYQCQDTERQYLNGTTIQSCDNVKVGSQNKTRYEWVEMGRLKDLKDLELPTGTIKIGVFTDVKRGEHVEWIPTLFNVRVPEWAEWTESLNEGLNLYYNMSSTVENRDGTGTYDLDLVSGGGTFGTSNCKIGACLDLDGSSDSYEIDDTNDYLDLYTGVERTLNFWVYPTDYSNYNVLIDKDGSTLSQSAMYFQNDGTRRVNYAGAGNYLVVDGSPINDWVMMTITWNSSDALTLYYDGVYQTSHSSPSHSNTAVEFMIGNQRGQGGYWDGVIDEFGVWNRTLSQAEITQLYNSGDGLTYVEFFNEAPNVTLVTPADANTSTLSPSTYFFNCSATDNVEVANVSLWINGVLNTTQTGTGTNFTELTQSYDLHEGDYNWTCSATDDEGDSAFASEGNRTISIDATAPTVNQANNLTNLTTFALPIASNWNFTVSDAHLDSCYYATSDNSTNTTVTCNSANIETNWTSGGLKTVTYCANDTFGFETCQTDPLTVILISYTQSDSVDPVGEQTNVTYNLQVNVTGITQPTTTAYLYLNNTVYEPSATAFVDHYDFSYSLEIPDGWGNSTGNVVDWYWNYTIDGFATNESTTTTNTTVYEVAIDDCSTYGDVILNLSLKDEGENTYLNISEEATNIEVDLTLEAESGQSWQYANQWTNENNVTVCVPSGLLTNSNYSIDFTIGFDAGSHVNEFYYLDNGTLSSDAQFNSFTNKTINLMDLLTADSTSFLFNYFDEDGLVVDDIIVHVFRNYIGEGLFREVERSKQNDEGDTVVHLVEEDVIYYFMITKQGQILFTSSTYTALCQSTPCEIQLEESGGFQEFDTDWDLIDNGGYSLTSSSSTRQVNLTYSLTSSSAMNLTVYKLDGNGDYQVVGSDQETGTNGEILVSVPSVSGNTTFFATIYQDGTFKKSQWIDFEEDAGLYFGNTLALFLGALIILALGLMAVSEGSATIIFLLLGMFAAMALGLVDYRTSTGLNILIYFILAGGIIVWKLTRRNR